MKNYTPTSEDFVLAIQKGFDLLKQHKIYNQAIILRKLKTLEIEVSPASFSNIINNKKKPGPLLLKSISEGITKIIEKELGFEYFFELKEFKAFPSSHKWEPEIIEEFDESKVNLNKEVDYKQEGRLPIHEKVNFMQSAETEVIELGVRLNTFIEYFRSRNEHEFSKPFMEMLKNGINFKLFLLDPFSNEALLYFKDRAIFQTREEESIAVIKKVIERLEELHQQVVEMRLPGKFEVYSYKHIPYNHFLITDGWKPHGKMMISHYLYGIRRADSPVVVFSQQHNYDLYRKYWDSFKCLTKGAKRLFH